MRRECVVAGGTWEDPFEFCAYRVWDRERVTGEPPLASVEACRDEAPAELPPAEAGETRPLDKTRKQRAVWPAPYPSAPGMGGRMFVFQDSILIFQDPSAVFSQTVRYLPSSGISGIPGRITVILYVPTS